MIKKMVHKGVHILIPRTYECVTLHTKRDFADVISSRLFKWGHFPGLSGRAQCNHKGPCKRGRRVRDRKRLDDATMLLVKIEGFPS